MSKRGKAGNGEGTIYQRKRDGKWIAELTLAYGLDGKRKIARAIKGTRREAAAWLAEQRTSRHQGTLCEPNRQTVGQFLDHWLRTVVAHMPKASTRQNYQDMCRFYLYPHVGHLQLQKLGPQDIATLHHTLMDAGKSARTAQLAHAILRRALQQATEWQIIPRNPADAVRRPKLEKKLPKFLVPAQVDLFLEAARADRLHALFTVAVCTGLRLGELLALRWQDIDLEARRLTVVQNLVKVGGQMILGTPKSKSSRRTVPLIGPAVFALKRWQRQQAEEREHLGDAWQDPDLVFTTTIGTHLNPSNLRNRVLPGILERAGLRTDINPHALRHTCASWLNSAGVDLPTISAILGHSQVMVTANIYTHTFEAQKEEAARKLESSMAARKAR